MELKFRKQAELLEHLNPSIKIDKSSPSNYRAVAVKDMTFNTLVYSSLPFLEFKMNMKMSPANNFNTAQQHMIKHMDQLQEQVQCLDIFAELCPRSFEDIHKPSSTTADISAYKLLDKETFTKEMIAMKMASNCFSNNGKIVVFKTISSFNHSCVPNCLMVCDKNNHLLVISIQDIKKGDEVTIAFNNSYIFDDKEKRKELIMKQRRFDCNCQACTNDDIFPTINFIENYPTDIISNNGKVIIPTINQCYFCGNKDDDLLKCSTCKTALYCSQSCQKKHWKLCHRGICQQYDTSEN